MQPPEQTPGSGCRPPSLCRFRGTNVGVRLPTSESAPLSRNVASCPSTMPAAGRRTEQAKPRAPIRRPLPLERRWQASRAHVAGELQPFMSSVRRSAAGLFETAADHRQGIVRYGGPHSRLTWVNCRFGPCRGPHSRLTWVNCPFGPYRGPHSRLTWVSCRFGPIADRTRR